jgi:hypothetical protein
LYLHKYEADNMPLHRYSPRVIEDYRLQGVQIDEVAYILKELQSQYRDAVWNLFWLSVPDIDVLLDAGSKGPTLYTPIRDALAAVVTDVIEDEVLYRKVMMHPDAFLDWFEREPDYTIFDCYEPLGGLKWVEMVTVRADAAAKRITAELPPIVVADRRAGVMHVDFRRISQLGGNAA